VGSSFVVTHGSEMPTLTRLGTASAVFFCKSIEFK